MKVLDFTDSIDSERWFLEPRLTKAVIYLADEPIMIVKGLTNLQTYLVFLILHNWFLVVYNILFEGKIFITKRHLKMSF